MRIGEILVMNDLISDSQLEEVLKEQGHTRKKLGEILLDQGWMSERQLVEVLEFQLGFPVVNLYETKIDVKATQLISEVLARKHCVLPIGCSKDKIKVAMVDPLNYEAMEEIRMAVGLTVQPLIAMRSEIEQAITRYYGMQDSMEELLDDIGSCA